MDIKVGVVGKIDAGDEVGSYVKVIDDTTNTGGYLVLTAVSPDMSDAFDNWVEDRESLSRYFEESRWAVTWMPVDPV
jgi:hypothetical protein